MGKPFSILHISDLHRSPHDPISNDELISALVGDRDRYTRESPKIHPPEAIIVSGDIIQGVRLGVTDFATEIEAQYAVAEAFLDELVRRFLDGDRSRLVLVPGNHDVDWNTAFAALKPVDPAGISQDLSALLYDDRSPYRWDWKHRTLYEIFDRSLYDRRLDAFWRFFERFYSGVNGLLNVAPRADGNLFSLYDSRIGVAAFNSCHGNDCFAFHGLIRKEAIARSHLELDDSGHVFDLRMAVWHHSIEGAPYRTDYMDIDIVRGMIGRKFRLGLYGHQHRAQAACQRIWLSEEENMAAVSAGSLCAGAREFPPGVYRQYNLLEIAEDFQRVRVHVRSMGVANLFSRAHLTDFGGKSFVDLSWSPLRNAAGELVNADALRKQRVISEAEHHFKSGDAPRAIQLLRELPLAPGSYERDLLLRAAASAEDWTALVEITETPATIAELVQRVDALLRLHQMSHAREAIALFASSLQLPEPVARELNARIIAQEAIEK